ncbi:MAG: PAS domain-containing protein [Actinomycetes bacterium]
MSAGTNGRDRDSWLLQSITTAAVIAVDHDGRVMYWNAGAERLYGYPAEQMVGTSGLAAMIRPAGRQHGARSDARRGAGGRAVREVSVLFQDGTTRRVRMSDSALWQGRKLVGTLGVHVLADGDAVIPRPRVR